MSVDKRDYLFKFIGHSQNEVGNIAILALWGEGEIVKKSIVICVFFFKNSIFKFLVKTTHLLANNSTQLQIEEKTIFVVCKQKAFIDNSMKVFHINLFPLLHRNIKTGVLTVTDE